MLKPDQRAALEAIHARYFNYNQDETESCAFMAANGHPNADEYRALRQFYDGLKYACNSSARYFSYLTEHECAEFWAPTLAVTDRPVGFADFGQLQPSQENEWARYIQSAALAGWPERTRPTLDQPGWILRTANPLLWAKLSQLSCFKDRRVTFRTIFRGDRWESKFSPVSSHDCLRDHADLVACIAMYQGELPPRDAGNDLADHAERPLSQKTFRYANVDHVTVTATTVCVPLIPLGTKGKVIARDTAHRLFNLVEQGYPFNRVEKWFEKFLTPTAFFQLQRRFRSVSETHFGSDASLASRVKDMTENWRVSQLPLI